MQVSQNEASWNGCSFSKGIVEVSSFESKRFNSDFDKVQGFSKLLNLTKKLIFLDSTKKLVN